MRLTRILTILLITMPLFLAACSSSTAPTAQQTPTPTSSPDPTKFEIVEQGVDFL